MLRKKSYIFCIHNRRVSVTLWFENKHKLSQKLVSPSHRLILAKRQAFNDSFQSRFNVYLIAKKNLHYYPSSIITHKNLSTTPFITCNTCYSFSCSELISISFFQKKSAGQVVVLSGLTWVQTLIVIRKAHLPFNIPPLFCLS